MPTSRVMDPKHWTTTDGHRYTSVPVDLPALYFKHRDRKDRLCYARGPYTIVREPYVGTRFMYVILRDGKGVGSLAFHSRLKDAKEHVESNAAGLEVVNVA